MTAEERKDSVKNPPDGAKLSGEEGCAPAEEFEREMQREIDRLRRLVNEGLTGMERKLKNRQAS